MQTEQIESNDSVSEKHSNNDEPTILTETNHNNQYAADESQTSDDNINKKMDSQKSDARPKYRQFHAYPGRPQLLRFSSHLSRDVENDSKIEKFKILLENPSLNSVSLKELSWSGIPKKMRAITWRLLSGYLPISLERRNCVLERKRVDYHNLVAQYFKVDNHDEVQQDTFRQVFIFIIINLF